MVAIRGYDTGMNDTATGSHEIAAMSEQVTLPVTDCDGCDQTVLVSRALRDGSIVDECWHCGAPAEDVQYMIRDDLALLGYLAGPGDDGCDSQSGCKDGECGVRQPSQKAREHPSR